MNSAWAKFYWANKHMQAVQRALAAALDPNINPVSVKVEIETAGDTAVAVVRVAALPRIRTEVGLAVGDVVQNYRAALDHLAWGLVEVGTDPRPKQPHRVYFPMVKSAKSFRNQINQLLPGVPREQRALARRYQPYGRGDRAKAMRRLRNLSDVDKHRVLIPSVVNVSRIVNLQVTPTWPLTSFDFLVRDRRALNVGTPILRLGLTRAGTQDCEVEVKGHITVYPSLGRGEPLAATLVLIRDTVYEILSEFDELLGGSG